MEISIESKLKQLDVESKNLENPAVHVGRNFKHLADLDSKVADIAGVSKDADVETIGKRIMAGGKALRNRLVSFFTGWKPKREKLKVTGNKAKQFQAGVAGSGNSRTTSVQNSPTPVNAGARRQPEPTSQSVDGLKIENRQLREQVKALRADLAWVLFECFSDDCVQTVETLSEITRLHREEHFETASETQHAPEDD